MSLPTYSILDVLNFGERISVLKAEDHPLFLLCLDLVWQAALTQQGLNPRVTKVTMTTERMHSLRGVTTRGYPNLGGYPNLCTGGTAIEKMCFLA